MTNIPPCSLEPLMTGDFGTLGAVMITCAKREKEKGETLADFGKAFGGAWSIRRWRKAEGLLIVTDLGPEEMRPQERQERVSLAAIEAGVAAGWDYFLFLEDDVRFNPHIVRNLQNWEPLLDGMLHMGSLYNPRVAGANITCPYANTFIADPRGVYGSQAFILSRQCAYYVARHWREVKGMQDIKISRLAARMGPIFYHSPSLVQHAGTVSTWTDDGRFHTAPDYDKGFRV